jgi:hypothetical protein
MELVYIADLKSVPLKGCGFNSHQPHMGYNMVSIEVNFYDKHVVLGRHFKQLKRISAKNYAEPVRMAA